MTIELPDNLDKRTVRAVGLALLRAANGYERTKNAGWGKGVGAFARSLGVCHTRVTSVLEGRVSSKRIMTAWKKWQATRA